MNKKNRKENSGKRAKSDFFKRVRAEVEKKYTTISAEDANDVAFEETLEMVFNPDRDEGEDR